ncbi:hypothetical protein A2U01_0079969, partial [Trifolium medium]|nr:hypothetical protein [Trifolium medium]
MQKTGFASVAGAERRTQGVVELKLLAVARGIYIAAVHFLQPPERESGE